MFWSASGPATWSRVNSNGQRCISINCMCAVAGRRTLYLQNCRSVSNTGERSLPALHWQQEPYACNCRLLFLDCWVSSVSSNLTIKPIKTLFFEHWFVYGGPTWPFPLPAHYGRVCWNSPCWKPRSQTYGSAPCFSWDNSEDLHNSSTGKSGMAVLY